MKAIVLERYGTTEDLIITDVSKPVPKEGEVLVKLSYTSINAADLDYVHGHPLVRFTGLSKPGYPILGSDLVGIVEMLGASVTDVEVGDVVWADTSNPLSYGTFAEYIVVPAKSLRKLSANQDLEKAACLPSAGVVAYQNIQLLKQVEPGKTALVIGAGGGIGNIIVQYLVSMGLVVTAVDKASKHAMLKGIGVVNTIDYEETDVVNAGQEYDYVVDLVCPGDLKSSVYLTKEKGQFIMLGGSTKNILRVLTQGPLLSKLWNRKIKLGMYETNDAKALQQLDADLKAGKILPVIDRVIPLEEVIDGLKALEGGQVLGKIVVKMN